MEGAYTYEKKKRLANKISSIKKKEDLLNIFDIIYSDNKDVSENHNGIFMLFHTLNDTTYCRIETYLKSISKKRVSSETTSERDEKIEFIPYEKNEFPEQEMLSPKLKYNNRERNMIKRQRYDEQCNDSSETPISISQQFNVNAFKA